MCFAGRWLNRTALINWQMQIFKRNNTIYFEAEQIYCDAVFIFLYYSLEIEKTKHDWIACILFNFTPTCCVCVCNIRPEQKDVNRTQVQLHNNMHCYPQLHPRCVWHICTWLCYQFSHCMYVHNVLYLWHNINSKWKISIAIIA